MEEAAIYNISLLSIGLAAIRPAAVFLILPAFSPQVIPATVRNSIFIALGLVVLAINPPGSRELSITPLFVMREILIGASIGLFFSVFLFAIETAGQIIDNVSGRSFAMVVDPLGGHQTSMTGTFFGRLGQFVFMFAGGFTLMVGTLIESYALWPLGSGLPDLEPAGAALFSGEFQRLMTTAVLFAGPVLLVLFAVDLALGLVNRFAQQFNVFSLSLSIKAWLSVLFVLSLVSVVIRAVMEDFARAADQALRYLLLIGGN